MAKKANKCCFCGKQSIGDYGATNQDNGKFLCYECLEELYVALAAELAEQKMNDSVVETVIEAEYEKED